jgi:O-methyltransferase
MSSHHYHRSLFFGLRDAGQFYRGINAALGALTSTVGSFAGDNLFTIGRNLSFLTDPRFMEAFQKHAKTDVEQAIIWRIATVVWAANNAMRLGGDLVECACYKGVTARIVCDYVNFAGEPDRRYFLYDLFEHDASMPHHHMPEHGATLFDQVKARFADLPNVVVSQGRVPEVLATAAPDKIAFMHIDLNNAEAEIGALEVLFDRMVPGAVLILDDYGWIGYRKQKLAEDPWLAARGYKVLELPTGQGMVIK